MSSSREVKCIACAWSAVRGGGNGVLVEPCPSCGARVSFAELSPGEMTHDAEPKLVRQALVPVSTPRRVNPVAEFLRATAAKLDSRKFYDAPLDQYVAAICDRAEFLVLADELDGPQQADWPLAIPKPTFRPRTNLPMLPTIRRAAPNPPELASTAPYSPVPATDRPESLTNRLTVISEQSAVISEQNSFSEQDSLSAQSHSERIEDVCEAVHSADTLHTPISVIEMPKKTGAGRPRKWQSDAERMATVREQQKPLILPPLPEGVYRAREVVTATGKSSPSSTARRNYHAHLQENRCYFCERQFGTYVQKNSAKPEALRVEDEHFIPRRLPGARKDDNRHAVCHICNKLKSDLVFKSEEQCREWLAQAWVLNGYREVEVRAIHYLARDHSVLFEERLAA